MILWQAAPLSVLPTAVLHLHQYCSCLPEEFASHTVRSIGRMVSAESDLLFCVALTYVQGWRYQAYSLAVKGNVVLVRACHLACFAALRNA